MTRLTSCADAESVARRAAADIARHLKRAREDDGVAHLALSGGTTPTRTYELLAREPVDWSAVEVWFADERCVPPTAPDSNYRLAAEVLLTPAGIPPQRVHRMEGELGPHEGARRYAEALRGHTATPAGEQAVGSPAAVPAASAPAEDQLGVPALDLIVLGIGPDGHVASLFPGATALEDDDEALCVGVEDSPKPPPQRITLSLAVLRAARRCLLLATGAGKADAVSAMLAEPSPHVPASLLRRDRLAVIVDDAASPTPMHG
jgi:6-phosphogluconolactonase